MASSTTGHSKASPCQGFSFSTGILYNLLIFYSYTQRGPVSQQAPFVYLGVIATTKKLTQHDVHKMERKGKTQTEWRGLIKLIDIIDMCLYLKSREWEIVAPQGDELMRARRDGTQITYRWDAEKKHIVCGRHEMALAYCYKIFWHDEW